MRMLTTKLSVIVIVALAGSAAWAQNDGTTGNNAAGNSSSTTANVNPVPDAFGTPLSITPQVGTVGFETASQTYDSRIIEGVTFNFNLASLVNPAPGWNIGIQSGVLYSHIGSPDANWFGANSTALSSESSNMYLVPIQLQIGYKPTDYSMVALDLGGEMIDRSTGSAQYFGRPNTDGDSGNVVDFFPAVGVNFGWELGRQVALILRGDAIPMPSSVAFDAALGLTIGLV